MSYGSIMGQKQTSTGGGSSSSNQNIIMQFYDKSTANQFTHNFSFGFNEGDNIKLPSEYLANPSNYNIGVLTCVYGGPISQTTLPTEAPLFYNGSLYIVNPEFYNNTTYYCFDITNGGYMRLKIDKETNEEWYVTLKNIGPTLPGGTDSYQRVFYASLQLTFSLK